jgi:acyl-CoA hydrolase
MPIEVSLSALDFKKIVRRGDTVCWGQAAAEPVSLTRALLADRAKIGGFAAFVGIGWSGSTDPQFCDYVRFVSYCAAGSNRALAGNGQLDILPCHYSALGAILERQVDVLLLQVAPAGSDGRYSLSLASEYLAPLIETTRVVIAEVNDRAPFTYSEPMIDPGLIDVIVRTSRPLLEAKAISPSPVDLAIGRQVAELVEDGAVLQIGLGSIPEAVLQSLFGHRDLGVHSGLICDAIVDLVERGAITNALKILDTGLTVAGLLAGSHRLAAFADRNASVAVRPTTYTHSAQVLERLDRFTAINSAIEVDLTGQVNAEVADQRYVGAVGGAIDFLRGAQRAYRGLPIVALPSTAKGKGGPLSRIVPRLANAVSASRSDAGVIVTEHGVADLRNLSITQRMKHMIKIAALQFRDDLERAAASMPGSTFAAVPTGRV